MAEQCFLGHVFRQVSDNLRLRQVPFTDMSHSSTNNRRRLEETDDKFTIPAGALKSGNNVVTVVQVRIS